MSEELLDPVVEGTEPHLNGELPDGELVHWGQRKPLRVGPAGLSATAVGGFVLGVAATLSVLALAGWIGPERKLPDFRA